MSRSLRLFALILAVGLSGSIGAPQLSSRDTMRELFPMVFNPDGTVNCREWCGILDPCC